MTHITGPTKMIFYLSWISLVYPLPNPAKGEVPAAGGSTLAPATRQELQQLTTLLFLLLLQFFDLTHELLEQGVPCPVRRGHGDP